MGIVRGHGQSEGVGDGNVLVLGQTEGVKVVIVRECTGLRLD